MRRAALDDAVRLLLNACAAAALLAAPGCTQDSISQEDDASDTPSDCGGGGPVWTRDDVELEESGTIVSITRRGGQFIALLTEGTLLPIEGVGDAIVEMLPGVELRAWAELSNGVRLAVGDGGQILRSSSGTFEWTTVDAGITEDLLDVIAHGVGAVAITSHRVLFSSDAGLTWTEVEPGSWTGLRRMFRAAGQFWVVGEGGRAWVTSEPSGSWESVEIGTSEDLLDGGEAGCTCVVIVSASSIHVRDGDGWTSLPAPEGELFTTIGDQYVATNRGIYELRPLEGSLATVGIIDFTVTAIAGSSNSIFVAGSDQLRHYTLDSGDTCLGRPWMIDGAATTASLQGGSNEGWARDGLFEHASVASFAHFVSELLALGAPPALIQAAQAAILDELEHARLCFELAAREHGVVRAGPLPLDPQSTARAGDPVALALAVFEEGCIGESVAAAEASVAALEADDDRARRALLQIAEDERRHAALAWKTLRWLVDSFGEPVRTALRRRLATLAVGGDEVRARVIAVVVGPLARELSSPPKLHQHC
jgi:hypothetical protein